MAAVAKKAGSDAKQFNYAWTGKDKAGKVVRGELRAGGDSIVAAQLRRQGIQVTSVKKVRQKGGKSITEKDITIFTRQLAVMMKAGVPLLQAFDIVGRGHANPSVGKLLLDTEGHRRVARQTVDRLAHDRIERARRGPLDQVDEASVSRYRDVESD